MQSMMRGGRLVGQDAPRGREVFWDAGLNLQSSPTGEGVPIHVNHLGSIEREGGTGTGAPAPGIMARGQIELNCGGDVCLSRLAAPVTVHHDAVDCRRAIAWAVICFAEFTGWHWILGGGREGGLPRAGKGSGVMGSSSSNSPRLWPRT